MAGAGFIVSLGRESSGCFVLLLWGERRIIWQAGRVDAGLVFWSGRLLPRLAEGCERNN